MDPHQKAKEEELRRREAELKTRELQIRMRELEAELEETPVQPTYKHEEPQKPTKKQTWYKRIPNIAKFLLMVLLVIVVMRIASWLFAAVLVLGLAFVGYKLFLEGGRD